ncbi:hypothetical protein HRR83_002950 [Exophiala dermatitidis]|uniref:Uncharacterized protein n=1 Tax=Exophiala dermatitidis TaxID=5970 RepID=A0AAN6ENB7_EXODE|nr:hypothetical protein HRR73_008044 [Exophiala dermatitidis]KAJ4520622.1 hypothetical protein HRR74_003620 [Exophiala dermatitidis]KAJ4537738.1 hypothetical protein HRR76_005727 [Exophiala dermatitidis]KAJ4551599.1 hypothetical protein HRR77_002832 [Exophiala dermatitidis]KAJ4569333.1 hypothetical protein HRR79_004186 [Exophiala dermatitidis]
MAPVYHDPNTEARHDVNAQPVPAQQDYIYIIIDEDVEVEFESEVDCECQRNDDPGNLQ